MYIAMLYFYVNYLYNYDENIYLSLRSKMSNVI